MDVAVVGAGRVGTALAVLWRDAGHRIVGVAGSAATPARAARFLPGVPVVEAADAARGAEVVAIATPDAVIAEVCRALASAGALGPGSSVVHASGATRLDALASARAAGARVLSVHPLQTCPTVEAALERLPGAAFAVTAEEEPAYALGERLALDAGGKPFRLDDDVKPLYHAAAVFASNYLVTVSALAEELERLAGVPDPAGVLAPAAGGDPRERPARRPGRGPHGSGRPRRRRHRRGQPRGAGGPRSRGRPALRRPRRSRPRARGARRASPLGRPRGRRGGARPLEVTRTIAATLAAADAARADGRTVGLVPTMGAFHEGHASLMRRAREERDLVVVSIFVNPTQFADPADLAAYPRDEARDLEIARGLGVDVVFAPTPEEMYPAGEPRVTIDPGPLGDRLEGASRPGHFRGVATVVAKLFHAVGPARAYFGEKDAQQLAVLRAMVRELAFPVEISACPTVREPDGLAMSSRNARLSPEQRDAAGCLFLALSEAAELARAGERDAARLVAAMAREIGATPQARLDYAAVVDDATFDDVTTIDAPARALVAARFGEVRLIDNLLLPTA